MALKRMLIDASHPEETRVVVVDGNRLEDYDVEVAARRQLKGNIYLAKVTRVEPSLQAAFVDYGGNRHGFLAYNEIHPDYYQIPVADRERLLAEQAAAERYHGEDGEDHEGGEPLVADDDDEYDRRRTRLSPRNYKIQEVIKRRQIMLVQVAKEERGNKGAALTTYLSLAGRYCVLMPNTVRGGGISRKISGPTDRKRLKKIIAELEVPDGMAVIVRTAGAGHSKAEIKRDYEYLMRLWATIREETLASTAPALVYEEASLIKRSIRDLYGRDIEEIVVQGDEAYRTAKEFMKLFISSHAKRVKPYENGERPLFQAHNLEDQLDAIHHPIVQLRSGGYIVINPTEALVAIDVNSGRSTRERNIEETALRTNLEAADEIARQLRLRDLAGLIVLDFIDMESPRNQGMVERRVKEAMKNDRARVQIGRISPFGLLELSRQRLRPSLLETSFEVCQACAGAGLRRTTESMALAILRRLEDEGTRQRTIEVSVTLPPAVAFYLLNQKRRALVAIEERHGMSVLIIEDPNLVPPDHRLERVRLRTVEEDVAEVEEEAEVEASAAAEAVGGERDDARRGRRRRSRRRRRDEDIAPAAGEVEADAGEAVEEEPLEADEAEEDGEAIAAEGRDEDAAATEAGAEWTAEDSPRRRRRRGKRGGRRRARGAPPGLGSEATPNADDVSEGVDADTDDEEAFAWTGPAEDGSAQHEPADADGHPLYATGEAAEEDRELAAGGSLPAYDDVEAEDDEAEARAARGSAEFIEPEPAFEESRTFTGEVVGGVQSPLTDDDEFDAEPRTATDAGWPAPEGEGQANAADITSAEAEDEPAETPEASADAGATAKPRARRRGGRRTKAQREAEAAAASAEPVADAADVIDATVDEPAPAVDAAFLEPEEAATAEPDALAAPALTMVIPGDWWPISAEAPAEAPAEATAEATAEVAVDPAPDAVAAVATPVGEDRETGTGEATLEQAEEVTPELVDAVDESDRPADTPSVSDVSAGAFDEDTIRRVSDPLGTDAPQADEGASDIAAAPVLADAGKVADAVDVRAEDGEPDENEARQTEVVRVGDAPGDGERRGWWQRSA